MFKKYPLAQSLLHGLLKLALCSECDRMALSELLLYFHLINYALSHIHASLVHSKHRATESWALRNSYRGG